MWNLFECENLGEYDDMYLKMDVYILADCFESFIKKFKLNPCNYVLRKDFGVAIFKLLNNSVFGKTMENFW